MSRALAKREQTPLALNARKELERLEQDFGGRQNLVQALTFGKMTKDVRYLLGLLGDPDNDRRPLADICHDGRILPGELVAALASGTDLRSQLLSKQRIAARIPAVVGEVMQKATEYEDDCGDCQGVGKTTADPSDAEPNPSPQTCTTCRGTGRLLFPADGKCRDLALEMAGLTGQGGGVHVNTSVQVAAFAGNGSSYEGFERLQEAMDVVLFGAGAVPGGSDPAEPAVDAEVVPPEPAP